MIKFLSVSMHTMHCDGIPDTLRLPGRGMITIWKYTSGETAALTGIDLWATIFNAFHHESTKLTSVCSKRATLLNAI